MTQTIHELFEGWSVLTPLGSGTALLITTPSYLSNSILYVKMDDTGELKHFDSNDVRICGSPTYGESLIPKTPDSWKKDTVNKIPANARRNMDFIDKEAEKKKVLGDFVKYLHRNNVIKGIESKVDSYVNGFLSLKEDSNKP